MPLTDRSARSGLCCRSRCEVAPRCSLYATRSLAVRDLLHRRERRRSQCVTARFRVGRGIGRRSARRRWALLPDRNRLLEAGLRGGHPRHSRLLLDAGLGDPPRALRAPEYRIATNGSLRARFPRAGDHVLPHLANGWPLDVPPSNALFWMIGGIALTMHRMTPSLQIDVQAPPPERNAVVSKPAPLSSAA
jgi:hypothetical protein